jgi:hypothetical protein
MNSQNPYAETFVSSTWKVLRPGVADFIDVIKDMPLWSPDASRIAFQMARGKNYDVGVVRLSDRKQSTFAG